MKLLKKPTNPTDIILDISRAFNILVNQERLYHITITDTEAKHIQDLKFLLTNKFFNSLHKDYKHSLEFVNYLFVIEVGGTISKVELFQKEKRINNLNEHAHILMSSSIPHGTIEYYLQSAFPSKIDIRIEDITDRTDKRRLLGYLLKQEKILTTDNYNYKIRY